MSSESITRTDGTRATSAVTPPRGLPVRYRPFQKTKKDLRSSQVPVASSLFNRAATEPRSTRWRIVTGKWGEVQRRASRIARGALRGYC